MSYDIHGILEGEEEPARIAYRVMLPGVEDAEDVVGAAVAVGEGTAVAVGVADLISGL